MPDVLWVPQLAGALGRIAAPGSGRTVPGLDDIRVNLASRIFQAAGRSREAAESGDPTGAARELDATMWSSAWESTLEEVGRRLANWVESEMKAGAAESRMPRMILQRRWPTEDEIRAMTARLGRGRAKFHEALARLSLAAQKLASDETMEGWNQWAGQLEAAARRLEAAWISLEEVAREELSHWQPEIEAVRAWRRPLWPLIAVSALVVLLAGYLGLVIGGYLAAPPGMSWLVGLI